MDIRNIIERCGGAPHIAVELKRLSAKDPVTYRLAGVKAVYKWNDSGIPQWHWPAVMKLSGVSEHEIYQANRELEKKAAAAKLANPKRRSSSRVAA